MRRWSRAKEGRDRSSCWRASPVSASPGWRQRFRSTSGASRTADCAISARRSTATARFIHLSLTSNGPPALPEDPPELKLEKLDALLARSGESPAETAALFADLLGLAAESRYPPPPDDPQQCRDLTFAAMLDQLRGLARRKPVLLLLEDAHWIDSTSLEVVAMIIEQVPRLPVLFVLTFRPDFTPPWTGEPHVTSLMLSRLGDRETAALAEQTAGKVLPPEIVDQIVQRADGIPLFVEELTKTILESRLVREEDGQYRLDGPLPSVAIPSSLQASLMARLDRLSPVKEVAQIGSAIGRGVFLPAAGGGGAPRERRTRSSARAAGWIPVWCSAAASRRTARSFSSMPWSRRGLQHAAAGPTAGAALPDRQGARGALSRDRRDAT